MTGTVWRVLRPDARQRDQITATSVTTSPTCSAPWSPRPHPGHRLRAARGHVPTLAAADAARRRSRARLFQPAGTWTVTDVYDFAPAIHSTAGRQLERQLLRRDRPGRELDTAADLPDRDHRRAGQRPRRTAHRVQQRAPDRPRRRVEHSNYTTRRRTRTRRSRGSPRPTTVRVGADGDLPRAGDPHLRLQHLADPAHHHGRRRADRHASRRSSRPARRSQRPEDVGGDLKLATFNVLNYFRPRATSS